MDGLTLDQFAVFLAVVEEGSFSGAARRLGRAQSAITYAVQNLEGQTGTALFDRSAYRPSLTPAGIALLPRVRRVLEGVGEYRKQARSLLEGCEARLTLAVETVAPVALLTDAFKAFNAAFPMVEMALVVQPLEATLATLRQGGANLGLILDVPALVPLEGLVRVPCGQIEFVVVAAPGHPLAQAPAPLRHDDLQNHTQLLLSSGIDMSGTTDWRAHAINLWRVNDLALRHRLLLAGVGWGGMPRHLVVDDLAAGRLLALSLDQADAARLSPHFALSVAHLDTKVLGPAGRWLMAELIRRGEDGDDGRRTRDPAPL